MVKGVSKMIIEVNNTGSKLFEKIVFYVTPEYGNLSAKQLKKAASNFSFNYSGVNSSKGTLRKRYKRKRIIRWLCIGGVVLISLATVLILIL